MLEWRVGGVRYRVSLLFPALLTALLLCRPDGLTVSCLVASVIHEGGHLMGMLMTGAPPRECWLGAFGMRIRLGNTLIDYKRNLFISLAGPSANVVAAMMLFVIQCPTAALVHIALVLFNLLPVTALDGGEIVRCALCLLGWETKAESALRLLTLLIVAPMVTIGLWLLFNRGNPMLLIVGVYLAITSFFEKIEKSS